MVMVAQDAEDRRSNAFDDALKLIEVPLSVRNEITRDGNEIGPLPIGELDRNALDPHGGHAPHVQVGEVHHAHVR